MPSTPVVVLDSTLTNIANAIRGKNGSSNTYKPSEMPAAITAIPSGGGVGIPREVDANGVYGMPTQSFTFSLPSNATDVTNYALYWAFNGCTSLTSLSFPAVTTVSGNNALNHVSNGCTNLTSVDLSSLTTVSGASAFSYAFGYCTSLASVDLSSLTTVSGNGAFSYAFNGCTSLTSMSFPALTTVSTNAAFSSAFYDCTSLASLSFPALTASSFGSSDNQFYNIIRGVTGCTLHFPAAAQAKIATLSGYPDFGGTNTTVLFDL